MTFFGSLSLEISKLFFYHFIIILLSFYYHLGLSLFYHFFINIVFLSFGFVIFLSISFFLSFLSLHRHPEGSAELKDHLGLSFFIMFSTMAMFRLCHFFIMFLNDNDKTMIIK